MFVSKDRGEAFVMYARVLQEANEPLDRFRLKGLDPKRDYRLEQDGSLYGGDELMYAGLPVPELHGDFQSAVYRFRAVE
jgi:alpha-galactosidase